MSHIDEHPLPVEWLEKLETGLNSADQELLDCCPQCRATCERVQQALAIGPLDLPCVPGITRSTRVYDIPRIPTRGEIWTIGEDGDRALVLAGPLTDYGTKWWAVMAVDSEHRSLTPSDALLLPQETTLALALRLRTSLPASIPVSRFGSREGAVTPAGAGALEEILIRSEVAEDRFGAPIREESDWRLSIDPAAAKRWTRYDEDHAASASDAAIAAAAFRTELRSAVDRARGGAFRQGLLAAAGTLGPLDNLWPGAHEWHEAARVLAETTRVDAAAAAALSIVPSIPETWPVTQRSHDDLQVDIKRIDRGARLFLTGLPEQLEGVTVICALPSATPQTTDAQWLDSIPGLIRVDVPVKSGSATITLDRVAAGAADDLVQNTVLLPPGLGA